MLDEHKILSIIANGENSLVEFKEESADNKKIAKEMIAFSNHKGGYILLGVRDDGSIAGLIRNDNEERIMNICSDLIRPMINPIYYEITINDKKIAVIEIENGINKPYYLESRSLGLQNFYMRYGSTSREIKHRDELQRLFQASWNIHFEIIPASYANLSDLDMDKAEQFLINHKGNILRKSTDIKTILSNLEILTEVNGSPKPTIAGMILFGGKRLKQILPQAGIMCIKVKGTKITDKKSNHKIFTEDAFSNFDNAYHFFDLYNANAFEIRGKRRIDFYDYPEDAFREILANAIIHRDYTIVGSEISVWIFDDRIEIKSPGAIPNTLNVEKMKYGTKYHRNPILAQFFAYAGIVEMMGQGIPMANERLIQNGNPELKIIDNETEVVVIMYKKTE